MKEYPDSIYDVINDIINIINTYFNKNIVYNNKIDDNNSIWIKYIINIFNEYIKNNNYKIIYDKYITFNNQDIVHELKIYDLWEKYHRLDSNKNVYIKDCNDNEYLANCFNKNNNKINKKCKNFYTCLNSFCRYYHDINYTVYISVINYLYLIKGFNKNIINELNQII